VENENKKPSYRKQIAHNLRTQCVECICSNSMTNEMWVRDHSTPFKLVPFESFGMVSKVTVAVSIAVCEISSIQNGVTLKTG